MTHDRRGAVQGMGDHLAVNLAYWNMRTTLDLDDDLLAALVDRHPELSKTEAIEVAIRAYLEQTGIDGLRHRAGSMQIEDLSAALRRHDRHT